MKKLRFVLTVLAVMAAVAIAGCGGGGSSADLAGFAAPGSLVFVEGTVRPTGELKSNVDSVAKAVAGVDGLGGLIAEKLEEKARDEGEPFDFATEVEPWLGERAAVGFAKLKDGKLTDPVLIVQVTDAEAAEAFVDRQTGKGDQPYRKGSFRGVEFEVGGSEGNAIGLIGGNLVVAEGKKGFAEAVKAANGESLADESQFQDAISAASDGSLADVYVDLGGIVVASEESIDPTAKQVFENAGLNPNEATMVASVLPGAEQVEIDVSANAGSEPPPEGDASAMLGSLPCNSFAAFASTGFGEQLRKALDELDKNGIPGQFEPHALKKGFSQFGFDIDKVATSIEDMGIFATGADKGSLGGAAVFTTNDSSEVTTAIKTIGALVRQSGTPGVTALSGKANGFTVRSSELGPKPLVVAAKGERFAIGYGLPQTLLGLAEAEGSILSDNPEYKAAAAALGDTPISGFVDGPAALRLARALVPRSETGFWEAVPYLKAIRYIGIGTGRDGDLATAKLIVGIGE
ncbi:MAG: DUF3352 domain-containing protein [Chloroflexota bacterium]